MPNSHLYRCEGTFSVRRRGDLERIERTKKHNPAPMGGLTRTFRREKRGLKTLKRSLVWIFFFKAPQNRHPERSASQIFRVTQRLMARSRRTPRMLILPMPLGAFQPPKPAPGGPATVFPWGREQELIRTIHPEFKIPRTDLKDGSGLERMKRCTRDHRVLRAIKRCVTRKTCDALRSATILWAS